MFGSLQPFTGHVVACCAHSEQSTKCLHGRRTVSLFLFAHWMQLIAIFAALSASRSPLSAVLKLEPPPSAVVAVSAAGPAPAPPPPAVCATPMRAAFALLAAAVSMSKLLWVRFLLTAVGCILAAAAGATVLSAVLTAAGGGEFEWGREAAGTGKSAAAVTFTAPSSCPLSNFTVQA